MPDPPPESLFTRYVLENQYPLAIGLVVVGLVFGWFALRSGQLHRLKLAVIPIALGAGTFAAGLLAVTAGEHARTVVRALVDDVVAADLVGIMSHFSDDARFHFGSTRNAARDVDGIRTLVDRLGRVVTIEENRITQLRAYTTSPATATVHLGNWTETARYGPARSQCVVEVTRGDDGAWEISRVTVVSVNGQGPPSNW